MLKEGCHWVHGEGAQPSKTKGEQVISSSRKEFQVLFWFKELLDKRDESGQEAMRSDSIEK